MIVIQSHRRLTKSEFDHRYNQLCYMKKNGIILIESDMTLSAITDDVEEIKLKNKTSDEED